MHNISIDDITSLGRLASGIGSVQLIPGQREIELDFKELSSEETAYWEKRVNQYYHACGCSEGSLSIIFAMACFALYIFLRPGGFHVGWLTGIEAVGLFILSGAVGKVIGLGLGKKKLIQTVSELKNVLNARHKVLE